MKNKNILLGFSILLAVSIFAIGCTPARRPVPQTTPNQPNMNNNTPITENTVPRTNNTTIDNNRTIENNRMNTDLERNVESNNLSNTNMTDKADKIAAEVTKVKDVKSATVVITGNTALVGINMTSGTKGTLNAQVKENVENAVKAVDKNITRVSVTADPDLFTRIENIAKDIGNGKPLSGFGQEIEEIIRRVTPGA